MSRFIVPLGFILALAVSITVWWNLPQLGPLGEQMQKGGPLVAMLILLLILETAFIIERIWSLRKAQGKGNMPEFLNNVRKKLHAGDVDGTIQLCGQQRGSAANVIRAGLERYQQVRAEGAPREKIVADTQAAIQEANGLEVPLLERNLIALSTIASISTTQQDPLCVITNRSKRAGPQLSRYGCVASSFMKLSWRLYTSSEPGAESMSSILTLYRVVKSSIFTCV